MIYVLDKEECFEFETREDFESDKSLMLSIIASPDRYTIIEGAKVVLKEPSFEYPKQRRTTSSDKCILQSKQTNNKK